MSEISIEEKLNLIKSVINEYANTSLLIASIAKKCSGLITFDEMKLLLELHDKYVSYVESLSKAGSVIIKNKNQSK